MGLIILYWCQPDTSLSYPLCGCGCMCVCACVFMLQNEHVTDSSSACATACAVVALKQEITAGLLTSRLMFERSSVTQLGTRETRTPGCILWVCLRLCIKVFTVFLAQPPLPGRLFLFSSASLYNFQLLFSLWVTHRYLCVHLTFPRVLSCSAHLPLQITHRNLCDDTRWFIQWKILCTLPLPACYSLREKWRELRQKSLSLWAGPLMQRRIGQIS